MADITGRKSALLASDLQICIYPREFTSYRGTAAQLTAEGLIPPGFQWPIGAQYVTVEVGKFTHRIGRKRPDGHMGPMRSWISGDYWYVNRTLTGQPLDGGLQASIYTRTQELHAAIYRGTPEFARMTEAAVSALCDDRYQAFRGMFIREPRRGRPAKGPAMHRQGEAA